MRNKCRIFDTSAHGGAIVTSSTDTFVNNIPATRIFDILACPIHGPNPVVIVAPHYYINNRNEARLFDMCACGASLTPACTDTFDMDM